MNTNHDIISFFPTIVVPGVVTFHQETTAAPVLMIIFYAMPELYYFHPTHTEGIYTCLVL
jgi:hypothetical protein